MEKLQLMGLYFFLITGFLWQISLIALFGWNLAQMFRSSDWDTWVNDGPGLVHVFVCDSVWALAGPELSQNSTTSDDSQST